MADIFAPEYFLDWYHATKLKLTQSSLKSAMSGNSLKQLNPSTSSNHPFPHLFFGKIYDVLDKIWQNLEAEDKDDST